MHSITTHPPLAPVRMKNGEPILSPDPSNYWESKVVLNPAAAFIETEGEIDKLVENSGLSPAAAARLKDSGGACALIYRAQGEMDPVRMHAVSSLGLAIFDAGLELVWKKITPVIAPTEWFHNLGAEDPRLTRVNGLWYMYYAGYSEEHPKGPPEERKIRICLATTDDFFNWKLHGPVSGDLNDVPNKNAALLPRPVTGKWILLHRPMQGPGAMAIHWASSDGPAGPWQSRGMLMESYSYREFSKSWIGAGGPPVALGDDRYLMIYHMGHFTHDGKREYDLAAALLDLHNRNDSDLNRGGFDFGKSNPVVNRIEPLMRPIGSEQVGDPTLGVDNVLFTCANYVHGDQLVIPYAGSDSRIFAAQVDLKQLVEILETISK